MEGMPLVVFSGALGTSLEEDVYSQLFLTFLFVKPQLFSSTVSIKQVLDFLRSYVYLISIAEAALLFFPHMSMKNSCDFTELCFVVFSAISK